MKTKFLSLMVFTALLFSCGNSTEAHKTDDSKAKETTENKEHHKKEEVEGKKVGEYMLYGEVDLNPENALTMTEFEEHINHGDLSGENDHPFKIKATIEETCSVMGCWINVKKEDGTMMRVKFKDHKFTIPIESNGKEVIFSGVAKSDTTSVEERRHYAEDAGKTKEEIEKITEPEYGVTFIADAILVK